MEKKERAKDLNALRAFCQALAEKCPGLIVDLSLFNYKAPDGPKVRQGVKKNIPVAELFRSVLALLDEYDTGEDILWRPAYDVYTKDRTRLVNLVWLDDYVGLRTPWLEIRTSEGKSQAYFLLSKPVPVEIADTIQKRLAREVGDKGAGSFVQHRRFPGLANGKYGHEPLCMMFGPYEEGILDPDEVLKGNSDSPTYQTDIEDQTNTSPATPQAKVKDQTNMTSQPSQAGAGGGVSNTRMIRVLNYTAYIKDRTAFTHPTNDQSAIDMSWCLSMARSFYNAGWPMVVAAMTMMWELLAHSPEIRKRKKTPEHLRDYVIRTVKKAIDTVWETNTDFLDFINF